MMSSVFLGLEGSRCTVQCFSAHHAESEGITPSLISPLTPSPPHQVSLLVRDQLVERARDFGIILDDVSLVSFHDDCSGGVVNVECLHSRRI